MVQFQSDKIAFNTSGLIWQTKNGFRDHVTGHVIEMGSHDLFHLSFKWYAVSRDHYVRFKIRLYTDFIPENIRIYEVGIKFHINRYLLYSCSKAITLKPRGKVRVVRVEKWLKRSCVGGSEESILQSLASDWPRMPPRKHQFENPLKVDFRCVSLGNSEIFKNFKINPYGFVEWNVLNLDGF